MTERFKPQSRDGKDWFRQVRWGEAEQALFREKFGRARGPRNRAQYLRIQAGTLSEREPHVALSLYDESLALFPKDPMRAEAHNGRAEILLARGDVDGALAAYEDAVEVMALHPNFIVQAGLNYPFHVARLGRVDHFDRALALLETFGARQTFPVDRFRVEATRALIADARGERRAGAAFADRALAAAEEAHSGFVRHPDIGLVGASYGDVRARLARLVRNGKPSLLERLFSR